MRPYACHDSRNRSLQRARVLWEEPQRLRRDRAIGEVANAPLARSDHARFDHTDGGSSRLRADIRPDVFEREVQALALEVPLRAWVLRQVRVGPVRRRSGTDEPVVASLVMWEPLGDLPRHDAGVRTERA